MSVIFTGIGFAQQPVNCTSAGTTAALVRSEGKTEQVGDYLFSCTNAGSVAASGNITVTLSAGVTVTSKVLNTANGISEAAVVVTGSSSTQQVLGTISGNVITFTNVPIGGSISGLAGFVLDITNIRVDASTLAQNTSITETVSMTGTGIQTFAPGPVSVATTTFGLGTQSNSGVLNFPVCNAITAAAPAFSLSFGESSAVPNAFKTQGGATNTTLLSWFSNNTETGYFVTTQVAGVPVGNVANSGTRIRVIFANIPAGLSVYVPLNLASNQVSNNGSTATMVLTSSESGAYSPVSAATPPTGYTGGGSLGLMTVTGGTAEAVYEVTSDALSTQEFFTLPVYVAAPAGTVTASSTPITSTMSFAPVGAASNIPNFAQLASSNALNNSIFTACLGFPTSTWPTGVQGVAYSQAVLATGGTAPYTYTFVSGAVPAGLTYNASAGTITGVPTTPGTANFTIKVTDNAGATVTQAFTLTINPPTAVTPATPATGAVNETYSFTPAATGGVGSYTWSVTSGQVPGGLSFNTGTGAITGTPAVANTFNFTLTATDISGSAASQAFAVTINVALTVPTTPPLPTGVKNGRYSVQLPSTGGTGNNQWVQTGGTLPPGETLSSSGVLDGTLTTSGTFTFNVRVTDSGGGVTNPVLTVNVNPQVSVATTALPSATFGIAYNQTVTAAGGLGPFVWSITAGALPTGLTLNTSTGAITGTPQGGSSTFTIQVSDQGASSATATQQLTIVVNSSVSFNFVSVVDASAPLAHFRLESIAGTSQTNGYTYNFSDGGSSVGTGAPIGVSGNQGAVLDGNTGFVTTNLSGGVNTAGSIMAWINLTQLPSLTGHVNYIAGESQLGNDFDLQIETDNVIRFYTTNNSQSMQYAPSTNGLAGVWHMVVATFDNTAGKRAIYWDGVLVASDTTQSLTNKAGTFEIGQTSLSGLFGNRNFNGGIDEVGVWNVALSAAQVAQFYDMPLNLLPPGVQGQAYGPLTLGASGGSGSYSWLGTALPAGLSVSSAGVLSGTPSAAGTVTTASIQATDTVTQQNASQVFSITINTPTPALTITTPLLSAGNPNVAYSQPLVATGGTGTGYTWSVSAGTLPAGLSINSSTGVISGTPTTAGGSGVTITVTDSGSNSAQQAYGLVINTAGTVITGLSGAAIVNINSVTYGAAASSTDAAQAFFYQPTSASGPLLEYTVQPGTYTFRIISPADAQALFPSLTTAQASSIFTAWSFHAPYETEWLAFDSSATSSSTISQLFSGAALPTTYPDPQTAYNTAISGGFYNLLYVGSRTAAPTNKYTFTNPTTLIFAVPDTYVPDNLGGVSVLIAPAASPVTIPASTFPTGKVGTGYGPYSLTATGGYGTYVWSGTGLPPGLTVGAAGFVNGTPTTAGTYPSVAITATDPVSGLAAVRIFSITINAGVTPVSITSTSLPNGTLGTAYSQTLVASGGTSPYQWNVTVGTLPAGLTLNASTGVLSGTPTATGTSVFTVQVSDNTLATATQQFTIVIGGGALTITTTTLPSATQGTAYNQTLSATGGSGTGYTWTVTAGTVTQAGLALASSTGALTGAPTTSGSLSFTVKVTDSASNTATQTLTLPIGLAAPSAWSYAIANEGTNIVKLTPGSTASSTICSGASCHPFDIATDAAGNIYSHDQTGLVKISPSGSIVWTVPLTGGVGGVALDNLGNVIFVDNQNDALYRVKTDGTGLTQVALFPIQSPGELQDNYVAVDNSPGSAFPGTYVVVSDDSAAVKVWRFTTAGAVTTVATFGGAVDSGLVIDSGGNYVFLNYNAITVVKVNPATGAPTTVVNGAGICQCSTPIGLTLDPVTGDYIFGTGAFLARATAAGALTRISGGTALTRVSSLAPVPAASASLTITPSTLTTGTVGIPYGPVQFSATGGSGNYTWAATGLPNGWFMSAGGSLSGGTSTAGTYSITVIATDSVTGQTGSANYTVQVVPYVPPIPPTPPLGISGAPTSIHTGVGGVVAASFTASGGTPPYTFTASGLPPGVRMSTSGSVSGSPTQAGNFTGSVIVQDSHGNIAGTGISISVIGLNLTTLPSGTAGLPYSATVNAVGGFPPYSFSAAGLPAGLTISSAGVLGGIVKTAGTFTFTLTATDNNGATVSGSISVAFDKPAALTISNATLPSGPVNTFYSQSFTATGGFPPYTWSLRSGSPPPGLALASSGIVSGTPTTAGTYTFGIQATDNSGGTATATASITLKPAPVLVTTSSPLPSGMNGVEYPGQVFTATGGSGTYAWSITSGALPAGMTLTPDGTLSGTPTAQGNFPLGVTAKDTAGATGSATLALTIRPPSTDIILSSGSLSFNLLAPSSTTPAAQTVGVESTQGAQQIAYNVAVSPAVTWLSVANGQKTPDVMSVSPNSAALSLAAGNYTTTITTTCASGPCTGHTQNVTVALQVTPTPPLLQVLSDLLNFGTTSGTLAPITQNLVIQNAGGGSLGIGAITCEAPWCSVGPVSSALAGGASASIPITVNPAVTGPGFFRTQVDISTSGGKGSVPVTLFVAASDSLTLGPSGGQFIMQQGGAPGNSSGSFLVSTTSATPVNWTASILPGATWLKAGVLSGTSSSARSTSATYSIDPVAAGQLAAGAYYGQIQVTATGVVNSPLNYLVILNVFPATTPVKPDVQPAGLLFLTSTGINPPPQTVNVYLGTATPASFQASAVSDGTWLSVSPGTGSTALGAPGVVTASVDVTGLKPGVYRGNVNIAFGGVAGIRSASVTLIVSGGAAATPTGAVTTLLRSTPLAGSCTPAALAPAQTALVNNFSAPAAWPTPLAIILSNDCGSPVNNGQIVATFNNGDAPLILTLVDPTQGLYSATWTPRKAVPQVTINAQASAPGFPSASVKLAGVVTPNAAPVLTTNGTLNGFNPLVGSSVAPGTIVQIFGQNLANVTNQPATLPLPTTVNGTSVIMGGFSAPLFYVSPTQVNAQVPFELQGGNQYQVVLQANGAITTPVTMQLTAATPGIAAFNDGTIIAQHADGSLVSQTSPAKSGEYLVAYLVGLGPVNQNVPDGTPSPSTVLAQPLSQPVLTINGSTYPTLFAGLTPGLVGLYQINFQVPAGLPAGSLTLYVTQDINTSNQVTMPYQP